MCENNDSKYNSIIDIIDFYNENYEKMNKKQSKIENVIIPTINNYNIMNNNKFNIQQLKTISKHYKLKISGNKKELILRIYTFLQFSFHIIKIQKIFRGFLQRKLNNLYGPAFKNRSLCTNETDFITMDDLKDIPCCNFFSYKDNDGFIYGFDIVSLYNLIKNTQQKHINNKIIQNPYNRNDIPVNIINNLEKVININKALKHKLNLDLNNEIKETISKHKMVELKALSLFQNINALGNYSEPSWFLSLDRVLLVKLIRELIDIWNFRAQLTNEVKRNICPPLGEPFRNLSISYIFSESDMDNVRKIVLDVLEKIVNTGINNDMKTLGAYYVLGALTLVNNSAANALPWLYQSLI